MDKNLTDELNRIHNIEVIEVGQKRPPSPVRKRLTAFGKEMAQLKHYVVKSNQLIRQELSQQRQEMDTQYQNLCQKLDNLTTVQTKPKSILVTKDEDDNFVTPPASPSLAPSSPCLSRASSRISRASSRLSPEREQGILPVVQNLLVANKYMLKQQTEKFPEALSGIKRHVKGRETVANRLKKDAELIEAKITETLRNDLKKEIASLTPMIYGLDDPESFQSFTFNAIPESEADFALGDTALKNMLRIHSTIKDEGDQLRHLIQDLIRKYEGRLSASQFKGIIISMCQGPFRDIIKHALRGNQLNEAINNVLRLYGNIESKEVKIGFYFNAKVDLKNPRTSLIRILEVTIEAFPNLGSYETTDKAIDQALISLPLNVQKAVLQVHNKLKERHKTNPKVPRLDYPQFIELVEQHLSKYDEKSGKNIQTKNVSELYNEPDFPNID